MPGALGVSLWSCQIWSQYYGEVVRGRERGRDRANIAKMINMLVRGSFFWSLLNHLHTTIIKLLLQLYFLLIFVAGHSLNAARTLPELCPNSARTQPELSLNSAWTLPQTLPGLHLNSTRTPPWTWPELGPNFALNSGLSLATQSTKPTYICRLPIPRTSILCNSIHSIHIGSQNAKFAHVQYRQYASGQTGWWTLGSLQVQR